ncbi:MAG: hypothetical protein EBT20_21860 [Alphaproteobacteria bacterium]|nr:hypothetical protein [Alphaproteobacteria bacterium]
MFNSKIQSMKTINNRLMNRFYMVLNVLAFLKEWLAKFKDNTDYQSYVDELEDRVGEMQAMEESLAALRLATHTPPTFTAPMSAWVR